MNSYTTINLSGSNQIAIGDGTLTLYCPGSIATALSAEIDPPAMLALADGMEATE